MHAPETDHIIARRLVERQARSLTAVMMVCCQSLSVCILGKIYYSVSYLPGTRRVCHTATSRCSPVSAVVDHRQQTREWKIKRINYITRERIVRVLRGGSVNLNILGYGGSKPLRRGGLSTRVVDIYFLFYIYIRCFSIECVIFRDERSFRVCVSEQKRAFRRVQV